MQASLTVLPLPLKPNFVQFPIANKKTMLMKVDSPRPIMIYNKGVLILLLLA